jgi:hypothetical protein
MIEFVKGGTMNVWSPLSQNTEPAYGTGQASGSQPNCGTFTPALPWQTGIAIPPSGVIYVEGEQGSGANSGYQQGSSTQPVIVNNTASSGSGNCSGSTTCQPCAANTGTTNPPVFANTYDVGIESCYLNSAAKYVSAGFAFPTPETPTVAAQTCINPWLYNTTTTTNSASNTECEAGDLVVEGDFHGQATVSADSNIILSRDLTYQCANTGTGAATDVNPYSVSACKTAGSNDILGLLAQGQIILSRPLNQPFNCNSGTSPCSGYNGSNAPICSDDGTETTPVLSNVVPWSCDVSTLFSDNTWGFSVDAALVALTGSVYAQNWNLVACLGNLDQQGTNINDYSGFNAVSPCGSSGGSINGGDGYNQVLNYDPRLKYESPPYMLAATGTVWNVSSFVVCGTINSANFVPTGAGTSSAAQAINCPAIN